MMLVYGTSYAALILFVQTLFAFVCRFICATRSRGTDASITRCELGSMVTAMIESVRNGASFS